MLEHCKVFRKRKHRNKIDFLKGKGICFGCLHQGHISKHCSQRLTCTLCSKQHPSALHIEQTEQKTKEEKSSVTKNNSPAVLQPACGHIGAGTQDNVLSVVPVRVKAVKGDKVISVYAFIDPGSSATFCTERLMSQLSMKGKRTNILLKTMSHEKSMSTYVITGLEISGLDRKQFHTIA